MTTAIQQPRTIRATIDESAITRVSTFFDASITDVLNELMQNSRRSGATRVTVDTSEARVTISDDGAGIADPQAILSFGRTDWDAAEVQRENPAGMGLYSLARMSGVTVTSKTSGAPAWKVNLNGDHFTGAEAATVEPAEDHEIPAGHGTSISFNYNGSTERETATAGRFFPLPVFHNGSAVDQEDFLHEMIGVEEWEGLRIGVWYDREYMFRYPNHRINFHGVRALGDGVIPVVNLIDGIWQYSTKVDVLDCEKLELTLPARKEIVKNEFVNRLRDQCLKQIFQTIVRRGDAVSKSDQKRAKALGVDIPDPEPRLRGWRPETDYEEAKQYDAGRVDVPKHGLLVAHREERQIQHMLARAAELATEKPTLLEPDDQQMKGYDWYDQLERVIHYEVRAYDGDREYVLPSEEFCPERPDRVTVRMTIERPDGETHTRTMDTDVGLATEEGYSLYDSQILITKESVITPDDLTEHILGAYFEMWDDAGADSYRTQIEDARVQARRLADTMLDSAENAMANTVAELVRDCGVQDLPAGSQILITVLPGQQIEVEVVSMN